MSQFMDLTIEEIADACGGKAVWKENENTAQPVTGVVLDSRQVTEQGVFLATPGERVDGHRFIGQVFAAGAALVITQKTPGQVEAEHGVPADSWGSYVLVEDSFRALKDIAEAYRRKLTIPVIGITGSVGKTSTKEFIAGVLGTKYQVLKTEGNFNNEVGLPLTLLRIRKEHEVAVVEMGISDFGEMHRLSRMARPNICVITNIGQCHLENLKTRDGILKAKSEIFDFMQEDAEVCLNGDDDKLCTLHEVHGRKVHFFGYEAGGEKEVYASDVVYNGLSGSNARIHLPETSFDVTVPLPGIHMVINAAAASCVGRLLGLTAEQMAAGIAGVSSVGGRTNRISMPNHVVIDDCYNANPVSMQAALDLLEHAVRCQGPKVAILGDMFELGEDSPAMHARTGSYAIAHGVDILFCVGENSRQMYQAALEEDGTKQIFWYPDREALLAALESDTETLLPTGSTILVKASHGMGFAEVVEKLTNHILS